MTGCSAPNCKNRTENGKSFFSVPFGRSPAAVRRRLQWLLRMRRERPTTKGAKICEDHFTQDQFEEYSVKGKKRLKADAVPTIFSFSSPTEFIFGMPTELYAPRSEEKPSTRAYHKDSTSAPADQPSHAAAHPDYAPNLLSEPAPDLRVLMCIRKALKREPPEAIGNSDTQPSAALQPYDSGTQGSSSETEAAGQEKFSSTPSSINKLARKFEEDQAEVAKAGLPSFTDAHTEHVPSLLNDAEPDLRMLMCYRRALQREAPAASQTQPSAALQPHNSGAQGSSNKTEVASQDSSSSLNELARRLKEDHTEEVEAGAEDADQPTKEDPSAEPQVSPETLRHVKDNLQRHLLKLKKKRKKQ
uniref:Putative 52 kDa repressor of the inhibitor of the protein kin n=1 Tax=Ixodes ricinus TaxID=34613 RepID=V5HY11_IXORI